ncbi:MAG TPA: TRAP transporter fused permease subunit, partial [Candidatus Limnocylindrales bacterium]|nr:TRAP transporter fused permease subunit [Candidatus Limnocylindrales bacterium]
VNFRELVARVGAPTTLDLVFAAACTIAVLDLAKRTHGWALFVTALLFLAYGFWGPFVPGLLGHRGYAVSEILEFLYVTTEGIFGVPLQVSASYIVIFIIFSAFLERSGIVALFSDLAFAVAGRTRGGVAKVAVLSSALMGTVNGSGLANVTTTGSVTIPLMKRNGFEPHYAAAVEATASMGGQIMPPVMGVAAFLMAERLGVPYSRIAFAAIIPALLYFFATGVQIHFHATRRSIRPAVQIPRRVWQILRTEGYLLLPIMALIGVMMSGYSPLYAAVSSIGACLALSWLASGLLAFRRTAEGSAWSAFAREAAARGATPRGIIDSIEAGVRNAVGVAVACAVVGIIIGVVTLTGAGLKLSSAIIAAAGGLLAPTLILTMLSCFVLGMGLPTIPTYIITSTMAAPALIKLGVDRLAADFFVMYFGVLANVTPPVALAAYAAAGIAHASPLQTCFTAVRLSVAGFLVPYIFVYSPVMLGVDLSLGPMIQIIITSTVGVVALGAAMEGYFLREATWYERLLLIAAAIDLIIPGLVTDLIGAALFALIVVSQRARAPLAVPTAQVAKQRVVPGEEDQARESHEAPFHS